MDQCPDDASFGCSNDSDESDSEAVADDGPHDASFGSSDASGENDSETVADHCPGSSEAPAPADNTGGAFDEGYQVGLSGGMPQCKANASPEYQEAYDRGYDAGKAVAQGATGQAQTPEDVAATGAGFFEGYQVGLSGGMPQCKANASPDYQKAYEQGYHAGQKAKGGEVAQVQAQTPEDLAAYEEQKKRIQEAYERGEFLQELEYEIIGISKEEAIKIQMEKLKELEEEEEHL